jgi:hypothetical protein
LIGSLVIIIKKHISRQIIKRIPKQNILPRPTNDQEQPFQMASFHNTPRIIQVRPIDKTYAGDLFLLHPQNSLLCALPLKYVYTTRKN